MKYRAFGNLDWDVSVLGFGAMRLPIIGKDETKIDEPEAIGMIRHAIDNGVNYVDTAYPYHGGNSERVVGLALKDGYREKVKLADKLPPWFVTKTEDFDSIFNEQLERLQTDHIDFYLLHGLNSEFWTKFSDLGAIPWAEAEQEKGRIRHLGFSFHDEFEVFKEIVDGYDKWDFCQIQYNYMDVDFQAGTKGLAYAAEKGLPVVVMEPIRGGQLAKEPPPSVAKLLEAAAVKRAPADWALQWIWQHPEVTLVLSGMTALSHVEDNLASADHAGSLTADDMQLIDRVREAYRELNPIPCTNCKYCMPCTSGVDIPHVLELYNDAMVYEAAKKERFLYRMLPKEAQADNCVQCGECEEVCPQHIAVPEWLEKAHEWLGPKG
ncbi:MAG: aldo/keto reductase [Deltaproteobacteria bacterium]|nr:aldo/keto reductase [Deltaproteobacteria bacterium]